jgi:hypothetical protein
MLHADFIHQLFGDLSQFFIPSDDTTLSLNQQYATYKLLIVRLQQKFLLPKNRDCYLNARVF